MSHPDPTSPPLLRRATEGTHDAAEAVVSAIGAEAAAIDRRSLRLGLYLAACLLAAIAATWFSATRDAASPLVGAVVWGAGLLEAIPLLAAALGLGAALRMQGARAAREGRPTRALSRAHAIGGALLFLAFILATGGTGALMRFLPWLLLIPFVPLLGLWWRQEAEERAFYRHVFLARTIEAALPGARFDPDRAFPPEAFVDSRFADGEAPAPSHGLIEATVGGRPVCGWLVMVSGPSRQSGGVYGLFVAARIPERRVWGRVRVHPATIGPAFLDRPLFAEEPEARVVWDGTAFSRRFGVTAEHEVAARTVLTPERRHALLLADAATPEALRATWSEDMLYLWFDGPGREMYLNSWGLPTRPGVQGLIRVLRMAFALPATLHPPGEPEPVASPVPDPTKT